jgi:succinate dehydrogenase / fumarate reductase flavoprotein subunit
VERGSRHPDLPSNAGEAALARLDRFRYASGSTPTAELRKRMQRTMQDYCAVFRTGETLREGDRKISEIWSGVADIRTTDRSLIWNTDLIETVERTESRGAHAREDFPNRDDKDWMKHTLSFADTETRTVKLAYRPVHAYTLTNDIEYIAPKARVY